jgi:hypothetical protein
MPSRAVAEATEAEGCGSDTSAHKGRKAPVEESPGLGADQGICTIRSNRCPGRLRLERSHYCIRLTTSTSFFCYLLPRELSIDNRYWAGVLA